MRRRIVLEMRTRPEARRVLRRARQDVVYLMGTIPVTVCIEPDGEVSRVVANDDLFEWLDAWDRSHEGDPMGYHRRRQLRAQADEQMWPAWTWGW